MFETMRRNMKAIIAVIAVVFIVSMAYVGVPFLTNGQGVQANTVVATVNGEKITQDEFQQAYRQTLDYWQQTQGPALPTDHEVIRYSALDSLISNAMIVQAIEDEGIQADNDEVNTQYEQVKASFPSEEAFNQQLQLNGLTERGFKQLIREQVRVEALRDKITADVAVTDEEVAEAYEQVEASHILISPDGDDEEAWTAAEAEANEVLQKVRDGGDFAALAEQYSDDPGSAAQGGALGFFGRGRMVPEFEEAAFSLDVGETSSVVKSDFGYHIIRVTDQTTADGEAFDEQYETIKERLVNEKRQQALGEWLDDLQNRTVVEIDEPALAAFRELQQGNNDEAIALYHDAIAANPTDPYLHFSLANAYEVAGERDSAIQHMEMAVAGGAQDARLFLTLGLTYREEGDDESAVKYFREASEAAPMDLQFHAQLQALYSQMGYEEDAQAEAEKIQEIHAAQEERQKLLQQLQEQQQQMLEQQQADQNAGEGAGADDAVAEPTDADSDQKADDAADE